MSPQIHILKSNGIDMVLAQDIVRILTLNHHSKMTSWNIFNNLPLALRTQLNMIAAAYFNPSRKRNAGCAVAASYVGALASSLDKRGLHGVKMTKKGVFKI